MRARNNKAPAARFSLSAVDPGFTLLELIVAIFIAALVLAVSMPSFTGVFESKINSDAKKIASVLRYLNDNAIATREPLYLKINLKDKTLNYKGPEGEKTDRFENIHGVELQSKGLLTDSEITIPFGPSGASEEFKILLKGEGGFTAVSINPLSSRVKIILPEE